MKPTGSIGISVKSLSVANTGTGALKKFPEDVEPLSLPLPTEVLLRCLNLQCFHYKGETQNLSCHVRKTF